SPRSAPRNRSRLSSISFRSAFRSPNRRGIITCRSWSRPGATEPIAGADMRFALPVALAMLAALAAPAAAQYLNAPVDPTWSVPEIGALPDDEHGRLVRRGRDLVTATYAHIGPAVPDASKRYAGNNLACTNCHLHAGTKKFGLPLWGLRDRFPQYSARSGSEITIEDRVNSCMLRSMNGKVLPNDSAEMQAFVAYIKFLSTGTKPGELLTGM